MAASTKPLTTEAIALTEKKMDMALDDIIKMSKPAKKNNSRVPNKNPKVFNKTAQDRSVKAKQFLASRSSTRHGALAKRRSNFQDNQFPVAIAAARRAATAPVRPNGFAINRRANWNKPRVAAHLNRGTSGGINLKGRLQYQEYQQQQPRANVVPRQRPRTLDSLFANMKQERLKTQQNYPTGGRPFQQRQSFQHRRPFHGGQQQQQQQQQGRGWFAN